jgi:hypothetical protein
MRNSHIWSVGERAAFMIARVEQVRAIYSREDTSCVVSMDKKNDKPTGRRRADAFGAIALISGLIVLFILAAIVGGMP